MATSRMNYQVPLPTYSNPTVVYTKSGLATETFTIPKSGWYALAISGRWNSTNVSVNGVVIAQAQVTTSGVAVSVAGEYLFEAGTELGIRILDSNGSVKITDIS